MLATALRSRRGITLQMLVYPGWTPERTAPSIRKDPPSINVLVAQRTVFAGNLLTHRSKPRDAHAHIKNDERVAGSVPHAVNYRVEHGTDQRRKPADRSLTQDSKNNSNCQHVSHTSCLEPAPPSHMTQKPIRTTQHSGAPVPKASHHIRNAS